MALGGPQDGHEDDGNEIIAIVLVRAQAAATRMMVMRSSPSSSWRDVALGGPRGGREDDGNDIV